MRRGVGEWDFDEFKAEIDCKNILDALKVIEDARPPIEIDGGEREGTPINLTYEKTRLVYYQAEHQRLSLQAARKQLVPAADVIRTVDAMFTVVRTGIFGLAHRIVDPIRAADSTEEARAIAKRMINALLEELAATNVEEIVYGNAPTPHKPINGHDTNTPSYVSTGGQARLASPGRGRSASYEIAGTTYSSTGQPVGRPKSAD